MYKANREEEVKLIKSLLCRENVTCPKCGQAVLEPFHKKAKKSNTDYICAVCGERYRVLKMMDEINDC